MNNRSENIKKFIRIGRALANLEYDYSIDKSTPEFCIQLLNYPNAKYFSKLIRKLRTSDKEWITEFIHYKGLFALLHSVEHLCIYKRNTSLINSVILNKCLCCIKEILNLKFGMESIIDLANEDSSSVSILIKAALNENQVVKKEIFQIFSAIAMYSENGYSLCLRILEQIKKENSYSYRFTFLIEEIKNNIKMGSYLTVIIGFINCLLSQPEDLKVRLNIRFELTNLKLNQLLNELKTNSDEDLFIQIDLFEKFQREDENEAFDKNGFDLNNPVEMFNAIYLKNQNATTENNQKFLELLQILYQFTDEDCSNLDSIKTKNRFDTVLNFLITTLRDISLKGKLIRIYSDKTTQTTTDEKKNQIKQDYQINQKLNLVAPRYPPPPPPKSSPPSIPKKVVVFRRKDASDLLDNNNNYNKNDETKDIDKDKQTNDIEVPVTFPSVVPPPPPPPPPLPILKSSLNQKTKNGISSNKTEDLKLSPQVNVETIPPPPPPPSLKNSTFPVVLNQSAPLPPPLPSLSSNQNSCSSLPPPPPPPLASALNLTSSIALNTAVNKLESSLKPTVYGVLPKPNKPLKNFGWQKLPNTALGQNNVWKELNEQNENIKLDFNLLEELFTKTNQLIVANRNEKENQKSDGKQLTKAFSNSNQENTVVTFLDAKQNMNINVYLKKIKIPLNDFIQLILNGNSKEIGFDNLNCLKKILPEKTEVDAIQLFSSSGPKNLDQLGKAEKFIKLLTDVPAYELRINLMNYIEEFDDQYSILNDQLEIYKRSCKTILEDSSLKCFIRLVLAAGNFLNMNSYNGQAVGFKISILPKLIDIKTNKPSMSFLHVIVEQFDKENQTKENFLNELKDLATISNNNLSGLNNSFKLLKKKTIELLNELNQEGTPNEVKIQFLNQLESCNKKVEILKDFFSQIDILKAKLIDYYCEDTLTFNLDDFLSIFRDLCSKINQVKEEIKIAKQNEDKIIKRKQELNELEIKRKSMIMQISNTKENQQQVEDDNNVLANLLSNLKRGNMESIRRSVLVKNEKLDELNSNEMIDKNNKTQKINFKNSKANFFNVSINSREFK